MNIRAANLWIWNKRRYGLTNKQAGTNDKTDIQINLVFINTLNEHVELYWKDTFMATIAPLGKLPYRSYHGHTWNVKVDSEIIFTFTVDEKEGENQRIHVGKKQVGEDKVKEEL